MTPKTKTVIISVGSFLGGGFVLAVLGMAAQFWIATEVKAQLDEIVIPDTTQITTDVEVIKGSIENIETNIATALESQERFETIFTEYLINEANR